MKDILPESRLTTVLTPKGAVMGRGGWWVPIFCANCGGGGGIVPEGSTFSFWLCNKCAETYGQIAGTYMEPDEVFWQKLYEAQLDIWGREATLPELVVALEQESNPLAILARESPYLNSR